MVRATVNALGEACCEAEADSVERVDVARNQLKPATNPAMTTKPANGSESFDVLTSSSSQAAATPNVRINVGTGPSEYRPISHRLNKITTAPTALIAFLVTRFPLKFGR